MGIFTKRRITKKLGGAPAMASDLASLATSVDGIEVSIFSLDLRLDSAEANLSGHETRITTLESAGTTGGVKKAMSIVATF